MYNITYLALICNLEEMMHRNRKQGQSVQGQSVQGQPPLASTASVDAVLAILARGQQNDPPVLGGALPPPPPRFSRHARAPVGALVAAPAVSQHAVPFVGGALPPPPYAVSTEIKQDEPFVCHRLSEAISWQLKVIHARQLQSKAVALNQRHLIMADMINHHAVDIQNNYNLLIQQISNETRLGVNQVEMRLVLDIAKVIKSDLGVQDLLKYIETEQDQDHDHDLMRHVYYNLVLFHRIEVIQMLAGDRSRFDTLFLRNIFSFLADTEIVNLRNDNSNQWIEVKGKYLVEAAFYYMKDDQIPCADVRLVELIRLSPTYVISYLTHASLNEASFCPVQLHLNAKLSFLFANSGAPNQVNARAYLNHAFRLFTQLKNTDMMGIVSESLDRCDQSSALTQVGRFVTHTQSGPASRRVTFALATPNAL
jgi:hypothetical protein